MTFALAAMAVTAWPESRHRVYIDAASKGADIPESMYGMFFEEINHAGDGGLYGELLQNRSFEEHVCPGGMTYKDGKVWAPHALNYWGLDYVDFNVDWNIRKEVSGVGHYRYRLQPVEGRGCAGSGVAREYAQRLAPGHQRSFGCVCGQCGQFRILGIGRKEGCYL